MKFTTWNVNGLRAALGKGFLAWVKEAQPDVLCLQEVRAKPSQIEAVHLQELQALYPYITWNPAQRPGYSGVALLVRHPPLEVGLGLGDPAFDGEGRVIWARYPVGCVVDESTDPGYSTTISKSLAEINDPGYSNSSSFLLFNIYFPNGGHDLGRVPFKLDFYARLLELCDELHTRGEKIILCGDFNTAHNEIDLRNPKENSVVTGFLPEERAWIDRYLERGFVDVYRRLYPERVQYTWWTYRLNARARGIGWRLDYFLVSEGLAGLTQDSVIHEDVKGSDHCPVSLIL
jgi:exodeoxyribonuclease-3